jgi:hypothetical protein
MQLTVPITFPIKIDQYNQITTPITMDQYNQLIATEVQKRFLIPKPLFINHKDSISDLFRLDTLLHKVHCKIGNDLMATKFVCDFL